MSFPLCSCSTLSSLGTIREQCWRPFDEGLGGDQLVKAKMKAWDLARHVIPGATPQTTLSQERTKDMGEFGPLHLGRTRPLRVVGTRSDIYT